MPPARKPRPSEAVYASVLSQIGTVLDGVAAEHPNPGRTDTIRRLTCAEYQNAIRALLSVEIDAATLLPADEASHGFDNMTVANLSPTLLDRYVTAAQKVSRLAVGSAQRAPGGDTIRVRPDITQEERADGLPLGARGGALIRYTFARDGEYEVQLRLARHRNEVVEGLHEPHELEVLLDRDRVKSFTVRPPPGGKDYQDVDAHLKLRLSVKAGPHDLGVTFLKNPSSLVETLRQRTGIALGVNRLRRLAHDEGFVVARPKHTLGGKRDEREYRRPRRRLERLKKGRRRRARPSNSGTPTPRRSTSCRTWSAEGTATGREDAGQEPEVGRLRGPVLRAWGRPPARAGGTPIRKGYKLRHPILRATDTVKMPHRSISMPTFSKPARRTRSSISAWVRRRMIHGRPSRFTRVRAIISSCGCHGWFV
jgi:hypothetical protein